MNVVKISWINRIWMIWEFFFPYDSDRSKIWFENTNFAISFYHSNAFVIRCLMIFKTQVTILVHSILIRLLMHTFLQQQPVSLQQWMTSIISSRLHQSIEYGLRCYQMHLQQNKNTPNCSRRRGYL